MGNHLTFQPQKKTVLSREVYNSLRTAILDGELKPGERIVEGTIARQMNVSRAPLREAIKQLEKDGMVVVEAHRETRVISPKAEDLRELIITRVLLETLLYQFAATRISDAELVRMEELVWKMEKAAQEQNARELANWDFEFHKCLCLASGLERIYHLWFNQHVLLRLWLNVVAETRDREIMRTATSHRAILQAVKAKDPEAIAVVVFEHGYFVGPALAEDRKRWAAEMAMLAPRQYPNTLQTSHTESRFVQ